MTAAQDKRISELEAEIVARDQRIATLEDRVAAQPSTGTVVVREVTHHTEQPTPDELRRLYSIVTARWPRLAHPQFERGVALFSAALSYMSSAVSHSERRSQWSAGLWTDSAETWLRVRHRPSDVSYGAICAAACALGFGYSGLDGPAFSWCGPARAAIVCPARSHGAPSCKASHCVRQCLTIGRVESCRSVLLSALAMAMGVRSKHGEERYEH